MGLLDTHTKDVFGSGPPASQDLRTRASLSDWSTLLCFFSLQLPGSTQRSPGTLARAHRLCVPHERVYLWASGFQASVWPWTQLMRK